MFKWQFFAMMAIGYMRSAGVAKQLEDANDTGSDDILGRGLVFAADFSEWLVNGMKGDAPKVPQGIKFVG